MSRNAFEAKGENDSIFSFNFNNIDKVIVNDQVFKIIITMKTIEYIKLYMKTILFPY